MIKMLLVLFLSLIDLILGCGISIEAIKQGEYFCVLFGVVIIVSGIVMLFLLDKNICEKNYSI